MGVTRYARGRVGPYRCPGLLLRNLIPSLSFRSWWFGKFPTTLHERQLRLVYRLIQDKSGKGFIKGENYIPFDLDTVASLSDPGRVPSLSVAGVGTFASERGCLDRRPTSVRARLSTSSLTCPPSALPPSYYCTHLLSRPSHVRTKQMSKFRLS